jgi:hypothetical protein
VSLVLVLVLIDSLLKAHGEKGESAAGDARIDAGSNGRAATEAEPIRNEDQLERALLGGERERAGGDEMQGRKHRRGEGGVRIRVGDRVRPRMDTRAQEGHLSAKPV